MAVENDIVLIYHEEKPLGFARIESILPDNKPDWYHVKLMILQLPVQVVTWILRDVYINGETFTMGGKSMRLELVKAPKTVDGDQKPEPSATDNSSTDNKPSPRDNAKVISLADLKKKP